MEKERRKGKVRGRMIDGGKRGGKGKDTERYRKGKSRLACVFPLTVHIHAL